VLIITAAAAALRIWAFLLAAAAQQEPWLTLLKQKGAVRTMVDIVIILTLLIRLTGY
jgi:hypothetical protein